MNVMQNHDIALLRLLQLADSALPVGAAAHSFGLESLIEDGLVTAEGLESFLHGYLVENGSLDATFCRAAHALSRLAPAEFELQWQSLNQRLSARRLSRESRDASLTLGRRFLRLASDLLPDEPLPVETETHHVIAFGLVAGVAGIGEGSAVLAWLHQSTTALVSAAQRLAPVGQTQASRVLWRLKPLIAEIATAVEQVDCFTPVPEIAAMRHSKLTTRLFIS
jgi:urease accessory protein